ncbi:asparagine--tRNA ligase, partial [Coemansia helicoidea]
MSTEITGLTEQLSLSTCVVHVDKVGGSDATGDGSEAAPYMTPVAAVAMIATMPAETQACFKIVVRPAAGEPFAEITATALKKAKGAHELELKKARKQAEQAAKAQEQNAARLAEEQRRLEESKSIKLVEDPALPAARAIRILDACANRDTRVKVHGW